MTHMQDDPTVLLETEHGGMRQLFATYRTLAAQAAPAARRKALAEEICLELAIHARMEDELLYPVAREVLADESLVTGAQDQHAAAHELMCRILVMDAGSAPYDDCVCRLADAVSQHMDHERDVLFPRLRQCGADLSRLGKLLRERRRELEAVPEALREDALVSMGAAA
jgi:hemerythrin-like domain-containing protein